MTSYFVQFLWKRQLISFLWGTITTPNLVQFKSRKAKLRRGAESASPQVENVLNRPGEIGLSSVETTLLTDLTFMIDTTLWTKSKMLFILQHYSHQKCHMLFIPIVIKLHTQDGWPCQRNIKVHPWSWKAFKFSWDNFTDWSDFYDRYNSVNKK